MRRGEGKIKDTLGLVGEQLIRFLTVHIRRDKPDREPEVDTEQSLRSALEARFGSLLGHLGPVPAELLMDPCPVDSVPWSIRQAERARERTRVRVVWLTALAVSWSVTAVAVLRLIRIL